MASTAKGFYIVLEGIDGSGTTTHTDLLAQRLRRTGYCVKTFEEPSRSKIGNTIREYLSNGPFDQKLLALLFAADRREQAKSIRDTIGQGCIALSDRSWISSLVYQSYDGFPSPAPLEWIYSVNRFALRPDILVYIDVEPVIAFKRIVMRRKKRDLPETLASLRGLSAHYRKLLPVIARIIPAVIIVKGSINGEERSIDIVSRDIFVRVYAALKYLEHY
jgi:dTMP kinase